MSIEFTRLVVLRLDNGIRAQLFSSSSSNSFVAAKVLRWADDKTVLHFGYRFNDAQFELVAECIARSIWARPSKPYWTDEDHIEYIAAEHNTQDEIGDFDF